jgi:hypothetical protein
MRVCQVPRTHLINTTLKSPKEDKKKWDLARDPGLLATENDSKKQRKPND